MFHGKKNQESSAFVVNYLFVSDKLGLYFYLYNNTQEAHIISGL